MQYNEKYDRYVTKGGLVYRYSKTQDKLILCKLTTSRKGYLTVTVTKPKTTPIFVHRLVYETFVGNIPEGMVIDHINTIKTDNRPDNLRCVTHKENNNNPLTRKHRSEALKGNNCGSGNKGKFHSDFSKKFNEHFGLTPNENPKLHHKEYCWYRKHNNTCRWEKEA